METARLTSSYVQSQSACIRDSYKIKRNKNRAILLCVCLTECILNKRHCQMYEEEQILLKQKKKRESNDEISTLCSINISVDKDI